MDRVSTVSLRLSYEEKEAIAEFAKKNDLSMSQVIRKAVKEFLDKEK